MWYYASAATTLLSKANTKADSLPNLANVLSLDEVTTRRHASCMRSRAHDIYVQIHKRHISSYLHYHLNTPSHTPTNPSTAPTNLLTSSSPISILSATNPRCAKYIPLSSI